MASPRSSTPARGAGRVVVVGSANVDHVVRVKRLPAEGETVFGLSYSSGAGGKGLNQAVAAARQGARVSLVAAVGGDEPGQRLSRLLEQEGVDASWLEQAKGRPTGMAFITVAKDGSNMIVVVPGANEELSPDHILPNLLEGAAVLLAQLEVPQATVAAALSAARDAGAMTVLNAAPAPARGLSPEVLMAADVLVLNEGEAEALAGGGPARSAAALIEAGAGAVVVTQGARGAVVAQAGCLQQVPALPVLACDTTAAGDAFCGALAAALASGAPLLAAARRGAVAGGLASTRYGAVDSLPTAAEVDSRL